MTLLAGCGVTDHLAGSIVIVYHRATKSASEVSFDNRSVFSSVTLELTGDNGGTEIAVVARLGGDAMSCRSLPYVIRLFASWR